MIVASLAWTACSVAGSAGPTMSFEVGKAFRLKPGQSAQAAGQALRVGFDGVVADSRCPKGEQCVWAGDATVKVWLQQGSGPKQTRELHVAPGAAQTATALGHELRVVSLDPYPVTGKTIANADYVATLMLNRGAAADPER